jgi:predicted enzyme related to lactoylglutathione lyase/quinol monooxygenase YgiN
MQMGELMPRVDTQAARPVHLISRWSVLPGCEAQAAVALKQLAADVFANEPGTLFYSVHVPETANPALRSLPTPSAADVVFYESYANTEAFQAHVNGPLFTNFVRTYGALFVAPSSTPGQPLMLVEFLDRTAGFSREFTNPPDLTAQNSASNSSKVEAGARMTSDGAANRHPSVMFEIMAKNQASLKSFYSDLFGWSYRAGSEQFAYVDFPVQATPLLGGIGQADIRQKGLEPGRNFYIKVDDLRAAIASVIKLGGNVYLEPQQADGYHFAMVTDPEGNLIGLVEPFKPEGDAPTSRMRR